MTYPTPAVTTRARWSTPDAAIRDATENLPLSARGIDYAHVATTGDGAAIMLDACSRVLAALAEYEPREQLALIGQAHYLSYRQISEAAAEQGVQISSSTLHRVHRPAWHRLRVRLCTLGLVAWDT